MKKTIIIFLFIFLSFYILLFIATHNNVSVEDFLENQKGYQEIAYALYNDKEIDNIKIGRGEIYITSPNMKYPNNKPSIFYKMNDKYISDNYNKKYEADRVNYYLNLMKKNDLYDIWKTDGKVIIFKKGWVNEHHMSGYLFDPANKINIDYKYEYTFANHLKNYWYIDKRINEHWYMTTYDR